MPGIERVSIDVFLRVPFLGFGMVDYTRYSRPTVLVMFIVVGLLTVADLSRGFGAGVSFTSTSFSYSTETYSTITGVTQDKLNGSIFSIEMDPIWYYSVEPEGPHHWDIIRYYQKEVRVTWRIRNVSNKRMENISVAMRFLHRGNWTQPIIMKAGNLEPGESTYFTKLASIEVQLDETSEPYFYYIAASTPAIVTTVRTFTSFYIWTAVSSSATSTGTRPPSQEQSFSWLWLVALALAAFVAVLLLIVRQRSRIK